MVHWWILGAGFPIDTGDHGGCWQWTFEEHRSDCEHVYVIRTSRVLSPDGAWPERWLSGMIEVGRHLASRHLNLSSSSPVLLCRTQANSSHYVHFGRVFFLCMRTPRRTCVHVRKECLLKISVVHACLKVWMRGQSCIFDEHDFLVFSIFSAPEDRQAAGKL